MRGDMVIRSESDSGAPAVARAGTRRSRWDAVRKRLDIDY
jgi:hypothetical protein